MSRAKNLSKDYKLFTNILFSGAILISLISFYFSYQDFRKEAINNLEKDTKNIEETLSRSLTHIGNITRLIGDQIGEKNTTNKHKIAKILIENGNRVSRDKNDIFSWTLFNYVDLNNNMVASSEHGVLKQPFYVNAHKRLWVGMSRIKPRTLISSDIDLGIISKEKILPFGYGVTNNKGKFLGTIAFGINVNEMRDKLSDKIVHPYIDFAILDREKQSLIRSKNFDINYMPISYEIPDNSEVFYVNEEEFYHISDENNQMSVLGRINHDILWHEFFKIFFPRILNTIYLTIFFLTLLYFFRVKLINPIVNLSDCASKISNGKLNIKIPNSEIAEINSLVTSIKMVKDFIEKQNQKTEELQKEKNIIRQENYNKIEVLKSITAEIKNAIREINSNVEKVQKDKLTNKNISYLEEIKKLSAESLELIKDITDINQIEFFSNFKVTTDENIDLEKIILRSSQLMQDRAKFNKKTISTIFLKKDNEDFIGKRLNERLFKQLIVNLLGFFISISNKSKKIEITLEKISGDSAKAIKDSILNSIKNSKNISDSRKIDLIPIIKKNRPQFIIKITDHGKFLSEKELQGEEEKYLSLRNSKDFILDFSHLNLPLINYFIEMQGGMMVKSPENSEIRIII